MKILMTGSSGFIGKYLTERFAPKHELMHLENDLTDHKAIEDELKYKNPELVIHLAARTEVEKSFYNQASFADVNFTGTVNLIESMNQCENKPRILFASTMEVYGWQPVSDEIAAGNIPDPIPAFDEETQPHPNAPYAVAKYACEKYIEYAHRAHGLRYIMLRQTNAYGRWDNDFFVTEQMITQMLKGPDVRLGYGKPYRNFIFIDDLMDAWETCVDQFDKLENNIFCMGPNNAISMEQHAANIAKKLGWEGTITWNTKPPRPGEIFLLNSTHDKLTRMSGWEPKVSYDEGIDRTIEMWT